MLIFSLYLNYINVQIFLVACFCFLYFFLLFILFFFNIDLLLFSTIYFMNFAVNFWGHLFAYLFFQFIIILQRNNFLQAIIIVNLCLYLNWNQVFQLFKIRNLNFVIIEKNLEIKKFPINNYFNSYYYKLFKLVFLSIFISLILLNYFSIY